MIDLLSDMVSLKSFPAEKLGLPKIVANAEMEARHKKEKQEDKSKVSMGAMSSEEAEKKENVRKAEADQDREEQREILKDKLKDLVRDFDFPFDKKKEAKRVKYSRFKKAVSSLERSSNDPSIVKTDNFRQSLIRQVNKAIGTKISVDSSLESAVAEVEKWARTEGLEAEDGFDETNPVGKVLALAKKAGEEADELAKELEAEAVSLIESPTWKQLELIKENKALLLLSELRKSNPTDYEMKEEKKNDPKARQLAYQEITNKIRNLIRNKEITHGGKDKESEGLASALALIEGIPGKDMADVPKDYLEEIAKGYDASTEEFKKLFGDKSLSMGEILGKIAEKADELWDDDVSEKEGIELGVMLATSTIINAYVEDYDFNLPSSKDMATKKKDRNGRVRVTPNTEKQRIVISEQARRFKDTTTQRRRNALNHYKKKIEEATSKEDKIKYESAKEGVVVAMILAGDNFLPSDRTPVNPFFLEQARENDNPLAYEMISISSRMNKTQTPSEVRGAQEKYLETLSDDDFVSAVGGDNGPFSDFLELLKPAYCPDNPANGSMAGKVLAPGEECPLPLSPTEKKILRRHLTTTMIDRYNVVPNTDRDKGYKQDKSDSKKRVREKELANFLRKNKEEYVRALMSPTGEKQEEALALLLLNMREAQLQSLKIGDWEDLPSRDPKKLEQSRREMILSLIKKKDTENILELLKKVDAEIDTPITSDSSSMKFASNRSFIHRRSLSDPQGAPLMRKKSSTFVDYQARAHQFQIGDRVFPFFLGGKERSGVVVQLFPAIGMADVQFPHGVARYPVEDLVVDESEEVRNIANIPDSVPGGRGVIPVSSGPSAKKVASLYMNRRGR